MLLTYVGATTGTMIMFPLSLASSVFFLSLAEKILRNCLLSFF